MKPFLRDDDVLRQVEVVEFRVNVVGGRPSNDVGAKVAVAALEHRVRVPEVRPRRCGHE